ncbi:MAG: SDR family NAD(P)-dependent oxidoreductase [Paracoccaceae bacterium]
MSGKRMGAALVTGGWRGIGRAVVERLLADGWQVAVSHVPGGIEPLAEIEAWCRATPGLSAHPLDLREGASIRDCLGAVRGTFGGLDLLVNNAGVGTATVAMFSEDASEQDALMLAINAAGTLAMCRGFLALPATRPGARKLINLSSVGGGVAAFPGFSLSDGMSKAAIAHLTRQLAAETVHAGVDVFALCPGATDTEMFRQSTLNRMTEADRAAFVAGLPKGRLIRPEELAEVVAFLASPGSTVLHGAVIDASMGLGVRPGLLSEHRH